MAPDPVNNPPGPGIDLRIRALGLTLVGAGVGAADALDRIRAVVDGAGCLPFVLATIAFAGLTLGAALTALGRHVFDRVEVSRRWQVASFRKADGARERQR